MIIFELSWCVYVYTLLIFICQETSLVKEMGDKNLKIWVEMSWKHWDFLDSLNYLAFYVAWMNFLLIFQKFHRLTINFLWSHQISFWNSIFIHNWSFFHLFWPNIDYECLTQHVPKHNNTPKSHSSDTKRRHTSFNYCSSFWLTESETTFKGIFSIIWYP